MTSFSLPFSADILSKLFFCKNFIDQVVHFGLLCQCLFQHSTTHVHPKKDIFVKVFASKTIFLPNFDPTKKCLLIYIQNKISNKNNIFGSVTCTITTFVNWKNNHTGNRKHECFFFLSCQETSMLEAGLSHKTFHILKLSLYTNLYFHFFKLVLLLSELYTFTFLKRYIRFSWTKQHWSPIRCFKTWRIFLGNAVWLRDYFSPKPLFYLRFSSVDPLILFNNWDFLIIFE